MRPGLGQRQDILRSLSCGAAAASHNEVNVPPALTSSVVIPDIPIGIDVERGFLVLAEG